MKIIPRPKFKDENTGIPTPPLAFKGIKSNSGAKGNFAGPPGGPTWPMPVNEKTKPIKKFTKDNKLDFILPNDSKLIELLSKAKAIEVHKSFESSDSLTLDIERNAAYQKLEYLIR